MAKLVHASLNYRATIARNVLFIPRGTALVVSGVLELFFMDFRMCRKILRVVAYGHFVLLGHMLWSNLI